MIKFRLTDENAEDNGTQESFDIELKFKNGEKFDDWCEEDPDFQDFMDDMESGKNGLNPWNGVHDGSGGVDNDGIEYVEFTSYEIEDFYTAIKKWEEFFKQKNKLSKGYNGPVIPYVPKKFNDEESEESETEESETNLDYYLSHLDDTDRNAVQKFIKKFKNFNS